MNGIAIILLLTILCTNISCRQRGDSIVDEGYCTYPVSKDNSTRKFYPGNFSSIGSLVRGEIEYIPLKVSTAEPYVVIYGPTSVLKRIKCQVDRDFSLYITYSRCMRNNNSEWVTIKVYGHELSKINMYRSRFVSTDTIRTTDGNLHLKGGEEGKFDFSCNVNNLYVSNLDFGSTFKVSGEADSVAVYITGYGKNASVDLRMMKYRSLQCAIYTCEENYNNEYAISYTGQPNVIWYYLGVCREIRYRGSPNLVSLSSVGSRIYPEF